MLLKNPIYYLKVTIAYLFPGFWLSLTERCCKLLFFFFFFQSVFLKISIRSYFNYVMDDFCDEGCANIELLFV